MFSETDNAILIVETFAFKVRGLTTLSETDNSTGSTSSSTARSTTATSHQRTFTTVLEFDLEFDLGSFDLRTRRRLRPRWTLTETSLTGTSEDGDTLEGSHL